MKFLLDTCICVSLLRHQEPVYSEFFRSFHREDCVLSAVTVFELRYGALHATQASEAKLRAVEALVSQFIIVAFDEADAGSAAEIRQELAQAGTPIGTADLLIAGIARAHGLTVVTNNEKEFLRVKHLSVKSIR
ncbi:MAG: type II toxin-antitoxin system VapC family toxin [Luteolibacter sp.]